MFRILSPILYEPPNRAADGCGVDCGRLLMVRKGQVVNSCDARLDKQKMYGQIIHVFHTIISDCTVELYMEYVSTPSKQNYYVVPYYDAGNQKNM